MENIKHLIPGHLSQGIRKNFNTLPQLSPEEEQRALNAERRRRAMRLGLEDLKIPLSESKRAEVLLKARIQKDSDIKASAYWDKVDNSSKPLKHTAEDLFDIFLRKADYLVQKTGRDAFVLDEFNTQIIKRLCLYFADDPRSEKFGLDRKKGLLLMGFTGCGKTMIMKAFATNMLKSYRMMRTVDISYDFVEYGLSVIRNHGVELTIPSDPYGHTTAGVCYDDLGNEDERRRFGDKVNVLADIISRRYDMLPYNMTHVTTNLSPKNIEEIYGLRIRSRMAEMFNPVPFSDESPDRRRY